MKSSAVALVLLGVVSCSSDRAAPSANGDPARDERSGGPGAASLRLRELRARFVVGGAAAIGPSVATSFDRDGVAVRARIPLDARRGVRRPASARLPLRASEPVVVEDDVSRIAVAF